MQSLHFGQVVQSTAGRDRLRVFIVIGIRKDSIKTEAVIANGALRKVGCAKAKNPRHLKVIAELTDTERDELKLSLTDEKLRQLCDKYDNFPKKNEIPLDKV